MSAALRRVARFFGRWLRRALWLALAVLIAVELTIALLADHLDAPSIKARVIASLWASSGIEIDYGAATLTPRGFTLSDLVVRSAPEDRALAPELLRVDAFALDWSVAGLLSRTARIDALRVRGVHVTAILDEESTSIDRWQATLDHAQHREKPREPEPLSRALSIAPAIHFALDKLIIEELELVTIRRSEGAVVEKQRLTIFPIYGSANAGPTGLALRLASGSQAALRLAREDDAGSTTLVHAPIAIGLSILGGDVQLRVSLRADEQRLAPLLTMPPDGLDVAELRGRVRFLPGEQRTAVDLDELSLGGGGVTASLRASLEDVPQADGRPGGVRARVLTAEGLLDVNKLLTVFQRMAPRLSVGGGRLALTMRDVVLGPGVATPGTLASVLGLPLHVGAQGTLHASGTLENVRSSGEVHAHVKKLDVEVGVTDGELRFNFVFPEGKVTRGALAAELAIAGKGLTIVASGAPGKPILTEAHAPRIRLHLRDGHGTALDIDGMRLDGSATVRGIGLALDADVTLGFDDLLVEHPGLRASLGALALTAKTRGLRLDLLTPLASHGEVHLDGTLASADVKRPGLHAALAGVALGLAAKLDGGPLRDIAFSLPIARLSLDGAKGRHLIAPTNGSIDLTMPELVLNHASPRRTLAKLTSTVDFGPVHLHTSVDKRADTMEFSVEVEAPNLSPVPLLLPQRLTALVDVNWLDMGLRFTTDGKLSGFDHPGQTYIEHRTGLSLARPVIRASGVTLTANVLTLGVTSHGNTVRHDLDVNLELDDPTLNGVRPGGRSELHLHSDVDVARPSVDLHFTGRGASGPDGDLTARASWDEAARALDWSIDGALDHLDLIGALLPPALAQKHRVDWKQLGFEAHGHGALGGVIERFAADHRPVIARDPLAALFGPAELAFTVKGVDYHSGVGSDGMSVRMPRLAVTLAGESAGTKRKGSFAFELPSLHAEVGGLVYELRDLRPHFTGDASGDLGTLLAQVTVELHAGSITAPQLASYPVGDLDVHAKLRGDWRGAIRVDELRAENHRGGTSLALHGGIALVPLGLAPAEEKRELALKSWVPGRRALTLDGQLDQTLDALDLAPHAFRGKGRVSLPLHVDSGDLALFHVAAALVLAGVDLSLPRSGIEVTHVDGRVPILEDVKLVDGHVTTLAGERVGDFGRLRFADTHSFAGDAPSLGDPFLAIKKVRVTLLGPPGATPRDKPTTIELGPIAANLRVARNLAALDQVEAELPDGGRFAGQCLIDLNGDDTRLRFRGAVTGLLAAGSSDRLDANAAIDLVPRRRVLDGRIEIVRIGRKNVRDLVDLADPHHVDTGMNRVRLLLDVGFPKRVRLTFRDGFASLALELGGLVSGVHVSEIKGIPLGPVFERYGGAL